MSENWYAGKVGVVMWLPRDDRKRYIRFIIDAVLSFHYDNSREEEVPDEDTIYETVMTELEGALKEEFQHEGTKMRIHDDTLLFFDDDNDDGSTKSNDPS